MSRMKRSLTKRAFKKLVGRSGQNRSHRHGPDGHMCPHCSPVNSNLRRQTEQNRVHQQEMDEAT